VNGENPKSLLNIVKIPWMNNRGVWKHDKTNFPLDNEKKEEREGAIETTGTQYLLQVFNRGYYLF